MHGSHGLKRLFAKKRPPSSRGRKGSQSSI